MKDEIQATADEPVADAIAHLGRTEDLCFSPDGRRVAITCFEERAVAIVDVEISHHGTSTQIEHTALVTVVAPSLEQPHGVDWLDAHTLIVADRGGRIGLLPVPGPCLGQAVQVEVDLLPHDGGFTDLYGPGSVRVVSRADDHVEVLVCNNWGNQITRHRLDRDDRWSVASTQVWARRHLDLPDGLATSPDRAWLAVSNHNLQTVVVYEHETTDAAADPDRAPVGVLRGASYPHGMRFTPDGTQLLVADAGSPDVRHYRSEGGDWSVAAYPSGSIPVLEWEEFHAGNVRPDEGGPKGIEIDPTGRLLAVTAGAAPLRWFDLSAATRTAPPPAADLVPYEVAALDRETTLQASLARAELRVMETEVREHDAQALASRTADRAAAAEQQAHGLQRARDAAWRQVEVAERCADEAQQHLAAIQATRLWRAASPLRRAYGRWRTRGRRPGDGGAEAVGQRSSRS